MKRPRLRRNLTLVLNALSLGALIGLLDVYGWLAAAFGLLAWLVGMLAVELFRAWRDSRDWDDAP